MQRVFKSGALGTPPAAPASPSFGYATGGDPGTGTPATKPGPYWYHMMTEEVMAVVVAAGLTPDHLQTTQLRDAILALIAAAAANDYKASVRAATTANIASLAGGAPSTLDGVTLVANDRILVKDQTMASQNGIYYVATLGTGANGTWTRATDADQAGELTSGAIVAVEEGSTNADSQWMLTTDGIITIGTTSLTFVKQGSSTAKQLQSITSSVAGSQLTVGLNPTSLDFRSATLTTGVPNTRLVGAALSLVVPAGATLGTVNATPARLALLAIDNAGTVELAIVNLAGGINLDETTLISTTAISAAATSASVVYSTTARTNVPFRVVGFLDITEATAGTWATDATVKQGIGGEATLGKKLYPVGAAPVFCARAWCVFDGTLVGTNAPTAGGNVTSVTRNGVGDYTVNFTTAMPDANFAVTGLAGDNTNANRSIVAATGFAKTTSSVRIQAAGGGSLADMANIQVIIFC